MRIVTAGTLGREQMGGKKLWDTPTEHCREILLEDIFQPFSEILTLGLWIMELGSSLSSHLDARSGLTCEKPEVNRQSLMLVPLLSLCYSCPPLNLQHRSGKIDGFLCLGS